MLFACIFGTRTRIEPQRDPVDLEWCHDTTGGRDKYYQYRETVAPIILPVYTISNIQITVATKPDGIYWIEKNVPFVISADVTDTDSSGLIPTGGATTELMMMAEQIFDGGPGSNDVRAIAEITGDAQQDLKLIINMIFETPGNYCIDIGRVNRGLGRIGKPFIFYSDPKIIEFDSYYQPI